MKLTTRILVLGLLAVSVGTASADDKRSLNEPPEGFTAVFNGKDLSGWRGGNYNPYKLAEMSEEEQAAFWKKGWDDVVQHWTVEDGELVNDGHGVYLTTEKEYSNYEFWIDYKTVAKAESEPTKDLGDSGTTTKAILAKTRWCWPTSRSANGTAFGFGRSVHEPGCS